MWGSDIGVGARKFVGERRIFAWISPNLPEEIFGSLVRIFFCPNHISIADFSAHANDQPLMFAEGPPPLSAREKQISKDVFREFARISTDFHQIKTPASYTTGFGYVFLPGSSGVIVLSQKLLHILHYLRHTLVFTQRHVGLWTAFRAAAPFLLAQLESENSHWPQLCSAKQQVLLAMRCLAFDQKPRVDSSQQFSS